MPWQKDLLALLRWWFALSLLGVAVLPAARRLFANRLFAAAALSRFLGLLTAGTTMWWTASVLHVPFTWFTCAVITGGTAAICWGATGAAGRRRLIAELRSGWRGLVRMELLFFLLFTGMAAVRAFNPDILQTEKVADFAFLNGILASRTFPPQDPWFAGGTINYFYFGHYLVAFIARLSWMLPESAFNLGIASTFALLAANALGAGLLLGGWATGARSLLFAAILGNLDAAAQVVKRLSGPQPFLPLNWFNWWQSSRVILRQNIDITINEFPFWSAILADLHAHYLAAPLGMLIIAILAALVLKPHAHWTAIEPEELDRASPGPAQLPGWVLHGAFLGLSLGALSAGNTWDVPTYTALTGAAAALPFVLSRNKPWWRAAMGPALLLAVGVAVAALAFGPFHLAFEPGGVHGIGTVPNPKRTPLGQFLTVHGFFLGVLCAAYIAALAASLRKAVPLWAGADKSIRSSWLVSAIVWTGCGLAIIALCIISNRVLGSPSPALAFSLTALAVAVGWHACQQMNGPAVFSALLAATGGMLLLFCELFYIRDAYGGALIRQNTIFKFYFQAWLMLSVSSAVAAGSLLRQLTVVWEGSGGGHKPPTGLARFYTRLVWAVIATAWIGEFRRTFPAQWKRFFAGDKAALTSLGFWSKFAVWHLGCLGKGLYSLGIYACLLFAVLGTSAKCGGFNIIHAPWLHNRITLNGINFMKYHHAEDWDLVVWTRENTVPDEVILETTGAPFSFYGRVSACTGRPTVLGWGNHEGLWRPQRGAEVGTRAQEVRRIYTSKDRADVTALLRKYNISCVVVGRLEKDDYPNLDPAWWSNFGTLTQFPSGSWVVVITQERSTP